MKRILAVLLVAAMVFSISACGGTPPAPENDSQTDSTASATASNDGNTGVETDNDTAAENEPETKILVAFFSRADENYGVGVIEKGNTHIIADMIAEKVGADTFQIVRVTPYPAGYNDCTDEAKREQNEKARPALTETVANFDDYDVIFLGYPNWWGDMPMPVYTFLESYDFSGKTVIPFCTHAGSGLSSTVQTLQNQLTGATVLNGLAVAGTTAQNSPTEAERAVTEWLDQLNG